MTDSKLARLAERIHNSSVERVKTLEGFDERLHDLDRVYEAEAKLRQAAIKVLQETRESSRET